MHSYESFYLVIYLVAQICRDINCCAHRPKGNDGDDEEEGDPLKQAAVKVGKVDVRVALPAV